MKGIVPTTIILLSHLRLVIGTDVEKEYVTTMKFKPSGNKRSAAALSTAISDFGSDTVDRGESETAYGSTLRVHANLSNVEASGIYEMQLKLE